MTRVSRAAAAICAAWLAGCAAPPIDAPPAAEVFFDDFSQPDAAALAAQGWAVRVKRGHPGIEGAAWAPDAIALVDDPQRPGNRLLRLSARTDGTPAGTSHAQLCHARKYLEGTYAARVRFSDSPAQGPDGDVIVQTFYAVSPLRFDFDPEYSELDWEYLPNGGWGDTRTRLYGVSWQTVSLNPWKAYNQPLQHFRALDGWHVLVMQAGGGKTRWYLDGALLDEHGGRNTPAVPMSINFNLWFSPGGLLPGVNTLRVYEQDVDWVYHARNRQLSPGQVESAVKTLRQRGIAHTDSVPPGDAVLASTCDF
jgi:hypothetical protein